MDRETLDLILANDEKPVRLLEFRGYFCQELVGANACRTTQANPIMDVMLDAAGDLRTGTKQPLTTRGINKGFVQ